MRDDLNHARVDAGQHRATLYVPPDVREPAPTLWFLHGASEAALGDDGEPQPRTVVERHHTPAWHALHGSPWLRDVLVVCPQLDRRRAWTADDAAWVDELFEDCVRRGYADADRQWLTGFSVGGSGVFLLADALRGRWSALWPVDPSLTATTPLPSPDTRIWLDHGRDRAHIVNDEVLDAFKAGAGLQEVTADGADGARAWRDLGTDHIATSVCAYSGAQVYDWLR